MLKAVIFDLNGIFIQSPKLSERFEQDFNVPVAEFLPKLSIIMDKVRQAGAGSAFQYWREDLETWKINFTEQKFWDYWFGAEVVSEKMVALARSLRSKGIKVIILSNNFKERADYYKEYSWMAEAVDKFYFSCQTGLIKPDIRAWQLILSEMNLQPGECIYFDDQKKNIDAAESLGMKSFLFSNEGETENIIMGYIK